MMLDILEARDTRNKVLSASPPCDIDDDDSDKKSKSSAKLSDNEPKRSGNDPKVIRKCSKLR